MRLNSYLVTGPFRNPSDRFCRRHLLIFGKTGRKTTTRRLSYAFTETFQARSGNRIDAEPLRTRRRRSSVQTDFS